MTCLSTVLLCCMFFCLAQAPKKGYWKPKSCCNLFFTLHQLNPKTQLSPSQCKPALLRLSWQDVRQPKGNQRQQSPGIQLLLAAITTLLCPRWTAQWLWRASIGWSRHLLKTERRSPASWVRGRRANRNTSAWSWWWSVRFIHTHCKK